jgi:hypothetical protein
VTMHRRALLLRAGVVATLAAGALAVASPAFADDQVSVTVAPNSFDLNPGQALDFVAEVKNTTDNSSSVIVVVSAPGSFNGDVIIATAPSACTGAPGTTVSCNVTVDGHKSVQLGFKIGAKTNPSSVQTGETKQGQGSIKVTMPGGGNDTKSFNATLHGPAQAPTVPQVVGSVRDSTTGQPIKDATVVLVDGGSCGADKGCQTGTDAQGNFKFVSKSDKPITPGQIQLGATKTGYENAQTTITARAGVQPPAVALRLAPVAAASDSASAPADQPSDQQSAGGDANPSLNAKNTSGNAGTSSLSWGLIGLGIVLVLLGIGAIVFLLLRRKGAGPEEDDDDPRGGRGPGQVPPSRGVYRTDPAADPTMVARNGGLGQGGPGYGAPGYGGPGGAGQPTMAGANSGDATAMLRPPRPPAGEYGGGGYGGGGPSGGYGSEYGPPTVYGSPPPPPQPPPPAPYGGGYGDDDRQQSYGSHGYGGGSDYGNGGYGDDRGGYGGGYRDEPRHGGGGYGDDRGGYDREYPPAGGGPYPPAAPRNGYDRQGGGYDQGGYPPPDQRGYDAGGYGSQGGGHGGQGGGSGYYDDEPPSRHSAPPPPNNRGGQRPPLDWLDD